MRKLSVWMTAICLLSLCCNDLFAQTADADTTIYPVAEETPRFPACEKLDTTIEFKNQCAQQQLLAFMNRNIFYPLEARQNGNEGTVVLSFVVEKDGGISNPKILRDIGGGCGVEALRIVQLMIDGELKWVPGKIKGKPVRTLFNLPVRFKLTEAPPFALIGRDTVWTTFDEPLSFEGGDEALTKFLGEQMDYPASGNDSCLIGVVDLQLLIDRQANVRILNITDYNDLGFEFWNEAVEVATSSSGKWKPAVYQGNKVPSAYEVSMSFVPESAGCKAKVEEYSKAVLLVNEGSDLFNKGEKDAGIAKMSEGIALFPRDANFLAVRGQAYMEMNKFPEACADLSLVKSLASVDWYDSLLPVICR
ncbi:MAG: energy transducer TonB [Saprospiraceae bacterium]|nr:energy transducer TonB [Saprospiraceae bacterium]